ncbi:MAG: AIPR family protein [Myxococcales bacterium]|nr:AIPR family protein [Myxococcales bacterium]
MNDAISETLQRCPEKMLGRNNGITFRADEVLRVNDDTLRLRGGSIVNGCQTTMCVVQAGDVAEQAMIAVKIVVGEDSWDVAKSANYQNQVSRIDPELARFLRPQVVRKITLDLGYGVPSPREANIASVLDEIHQTKISYDALKLLYIGLFSRYPSNIF